MGRQDTLEQMLIIMEDILTACEKALADYLETKRKIFPRFCTGIRMENSV